MRQEVEAVYLFIAELSGNFKAGSGSRQDKINVGNEAYIHNYQHELLVDERPVSEISEEEQVQLLTKHHKDLATAEELRAEHDRSELHENIWLHRLYVELDRYFDTINDPMARAIACDNYRTGTFDWTVPIELDASASMLQYQGILLNDERLLEMTNVIGDTLEDPWSSEAIPNRKMLKAAATPMLYGSSQTCFNLWQDENIKYTHEDVKNYNSEMSEGPYGLANNFKEFIINNCNPSENMDIVIGNDEFSITCNRYRNVGEETKSYEIYDSDAGIIRKIHHTTTKKVADLEQFRRYFVTLLIHNLDSQVADNVMRKVMEYHGWGIPIHDAFIVSPAAASDVRRWYAMELEDIYANRLAILEGYFDSIGITKAASKAWSELQSKVVPLTETFKCSHMALK